MVEVVLLFVAVRAVAPDREDSVEKSEGKSLDLGAKG